MDVQMPEMGGLEATSAIRAKERASGAHQPIVAMTAHAMKGDRERCLDAGMDDYLTKPLDSRQLYAIIERMADHKETTVNSPPAGKVTLNFHPDGHHLDRATPRARRCPQP